MNKMNRKLEYALMALKQMSDKRPGELTTAKEIVEKTGCPFDATARVMQTMANRGLLKSEQGAHGGYQIVKDLNRVTLYDLIEMILGPLGVVKCLHEETACDLKDKCQLISPLTELNRRLVEFYRGLSIGEVLQENEEHLSVLAASNSSPSPVMRQEPH